MSCSLFRWPTLTLWPRRTVQRYQIQRRAVIRRLQGESWTNTCLHQHQQSQYCILQSHQHLQAAITVKKRKKKKSNEQVGYFKEPTHQRISGKSDLWVMLWERISWKLLHWPGWSKANELRKIKENVHGLVINLAWRTMQQQRNSETLSRT